MAEVHIELGNHSSESYEYDDGFKKLEANDSSGSFWPQAVSDRMDDYNPDIVVSDSLSYSDTFEPASPQHRTAEIDEWENRRKIMIHWHMPPSIAEKLDKTMILVGGDYTSQSDLIRRGDEAAYDSMFMTAARFFGFTLGIGAAMNAVERYHHRILQARPEGAFVPIDPLIQAPVSEASLSLTRRHFLRKAGIIGATTLALGHFAPRITSDLPTHNFDWLKQPAELLDNFRPESDFNTWLNGRTALLIQKGIEISEANDASVSVVMGSGHRPRSQEFVRDEKARLGAIRDFAELMTRVAFDASDTYTGMSTGQRLEHLNNNFCLYSLFQIFPNDVLALKPIEPLRSEACEDILYQAFSKY